MKTLSTFIAFIAIISTTQAQSLRFAVNSQYVENNSEIYFLGISHALTNNLRTYFYLNNNTERNLMIEGMFEEISVPRGTIASLCVFGTCLAGHTMPSSQLLAGATEGLAGTFYFDVSLNAEFEPATYLFRFNVVDNPDDYVSVTIHFIDRDYRPEDLPFEVGDWENDTIIFVRGGVATSNRRFLAETPTLEIYPNPVQDELHIIIPNSSTSLGINSMSNPPDIIEIFDMAGRRVHSAQIPLTINHSPLITINISHLPSGTHILRIGTYQTKIVKK